MNIHRRTHNSSHICDRGWHCPVSVGEKALGPVEAHFFNVGMSEHWGWSGLVGMGACSKKQGE